MTNQTGELHEAYKKIEALGNTVLVACFRDEDTVIKVISQLPYVKMDYPDMSSRSGTDAYGIGNIILKDGTVGFAIVTGGNLTLEETKKAMELLTVYGEDQVFTGPQIGNMIKPSQQPDFKKDKKWWQFWK